MSATPENNAEIELLLKAHVYAKFTPEDTPAMRNALNRLIDHGMVKYTPSGYVTSTLKGQFWINHIGTIPYPVEQTTFVIPEAK